jgi:transcriptional regulator with XRE-family HTH domain
LASLKVLFGDCVRTHRVALGMSQPELADAAGISEVWLRRIERGTASPSFEIIEALAAALKVQPAELFGGLRPADEANASAIAGIMAQLARMNAAGLKRAAAMLAVLED